MTDVLETPSLIGMANDAELWEGVRRVERESQSGATAVEYAVFLTLIAAVIIATVAALGLRVTDLFGSLDGAF